MSWFGKELHRPKPITAALNKKGIVGFDLGFATPSENDFAAMLVASGLEWLWVSSGVPEARLLTRLCDGTSQLFHEDLRDNGNSEGNDIAMFGVEHNCLTRVQTRLELASALREFASSGTGPVHAVYSREDDLDAVLYTVWPLSDCVRKLLASWFIQHDAILEVRWSDWSKWQTTWLEGAITHVLERSKGLT